MSDGAAVVGGAVVGGAVEKARTPSDVLSEM